jgi:hypothetical protein
MALQFKARFRLTAYCDARERIPSTWDLLRKWESFFGTQKPSLLLSAE